MKKVAVYNKYLPFVMFESVSGERFHALLDTGSDNTIVDASLESSVIKEGPEDKIEVVGLNGTKKHEAFKNQFGFYLYSENLDLLSVDVPAIYVRQKGFFKPIEDNTGLHDVKVILGMNFFRKYKAKIDFKNNYLNLKCE